MTETFKVGFIGSGNIAQAIIGGAIKAGNLQPSQIKTSAPSDRNFSKIQEFKVATTMTIVKWQNSRKYYSWPANPTKLRE
ncbi:hypothetical protein BSL78_29397 [Apostichopus japonicus]|uniref:Pyrroline-5-carboxylate reductase catalytic N-terminal domain-containing protein n=1 Tax=Stichopus japonicus TaxID=307972 RepID=A0A2G8JDG9_STIJA|nr:hypothetical protein BSL78_29397 [Apostichopus japonicus]